MDTVLLILRCLLALVFALAAAGKLGDRSGSRQAVAEFGAPRRLVAPIATLLPPAELGVAAALFLPQSARYGALGALVLLTVFSAGIARAMAHGEAPDCHCFGALHSEPAGPATLVRNLALGAVAGVVLVVGWGDAGPSAVAWIGRLHDAGLVALASGLALALVAVASAAFMLALLKQQGRLLLRIDDLQARLDSAGVAVPPPATIESKHGLPVGEPAPAFSLAGLYGETVTLEALTATDSKVMLLFTDPGCGPCNALMPQIAGWQREHAIELTIALISRGDADDNGVKSREHGIANLWLDQDLAVYNAYRVPGTPAAVLIDADAHVASPVVGGADAIAALVGRATGRALDMADVPAAAPPPPALPPQGLPIGTPAPAVRLRDLDNRLVRLTDEQRDTLVLFWNPRCGFCAQMLDELRAFEAEPPPGAPRLVLVSTGSLEQNRAMGLQAPIALDNGFATGTAFGTTGTPSAVLIDRHGKVASQLRIGAPGVLALAHRERSSEAA